MRFCPKLSLQFTGGVLSVGEFFVPSFGDVRGRSSLRREGNTHSFRMCVLTRMCAFRPENVPVPDSREKRGQRGRKEGEKGDGSI
jgi:hypothetical protein